MKRSRFSETEIVYAVKQIEAGVPVDEVCTGNRARVLNSVLTPFAPLLAFGVTTTGQA